MTRARPAPVMHLRGNYPGRASQVRAAGLRAERTRAASDGQRRRVCRLYCGREGHGLGV